MKIKIRLFYKMIVFIIGASALIYYIAINLIINHFRNSATTNSRFIADSYAQQYAKIFRQKFDGYYKVLQTQSLVLAKCTQNDKQQYKSFCDNLMMTILKNQPDFVSIWTGFPENISGNGFSVNATRFLKVKSQIVSDNQTIEISTLLSDSANNRLFSQPAFKSNTSRKIDQSLMVQLAVVASHKTMFLLGADIELSHLQKITDTVHPFGKGFIILTGQNGEIIAYPKGQFIGLNINQTGLISKKIEVVDKIKNGEIFSYDLLNKEKNDSLYLSFAPVKITENTSWSCGVVIDIAAISSQTSKQIEKAWTFGYIGLIILIVIVYVITLTITIPLRRTIHIIRKLSKGSFIELNTSEIKSKDEVADMLRSLSTLIQSIKVTASFANEIGKGNFDAHYQQLGQNDKLGNAIIGMRNSLKKTKQEADERKKLEEQLNWTSFGIAEFGKILRQNNDNLNKLTYNIIRFLTHYLNASEGGIYMVNDSNPDDIYIELKAFIGFGKEKYEQKIYQPGESLVGTCYLEKETIFITDVPDNYIDVRSGLGKSKPLCILIVPLILNEVVVGILEMESIKIIEDYQIKFVEKVAVSIAATLSRVKFNVKTAALLEQSKVQADELAQREEEIRQNMEELQATQEEANNRENEMRGVIEALNNTLLVIEYDIDGKIIEVNDAMLKIYKVNKDQMVGKSFGFRISDEKKQEKLKEFWNELRQGRTKNNIQYFRTATREIWLDETYSPIYDSFGNPVKVLCLAFDITESRNKRQRIKSLIEKRDLLSKRLHDTEGVETRKVTERLVAEDFSLQYIDLNYLVKVYKGDAQKIHNILNFYITIIPEEIDEIDKYYKDKNWEMLRTKASTLKTKMTYLGLKTMLNNSKNIEKFATEKTNLTEIPELIAEIQELWKEVEKELRQLIKSISELL